MSKKKTAEVFTVGKRQRLFVRAALIFIQMFVLLIGCYYRDGVSFGRTIKGFFSLPYFSGGVGFIEDAMTSDYGVTAKRIFIALMYVLLFCASAVVLERFIHSARSDRQFTSYVLVAIYIVSPAAAQFLADPMTMARADVVVLFFSLLAMLFAESKKLFLVTPVFVLLCAMFQKEFVFTYLPIAFIPLLYFQGRSSDGKVIIVINALITAAMFFAGRSSGYSFEYITAQRLVHLLIAAAIALPIFAVTFSVWLRALKKGTDKAYVYKLCMISVLLPLPMLLLRSCFEADRLVSAAVINQLLLLFMFVVSRDKAVCPAFREISERMEKHAVPVLVFVGLNAAMSRIDTSFLGFIGNSIYKYIPF